MQTTSADFTLTKLKAMNLDDQIETVTKTCEVAGKEFAIEQAMDKMEGEWKGINLEIAAYRETGTFVLKGFDAVQQLLDDHIVMTQTMCAAKSNPNPNPNPSNQRLGWIPRPRRVGPLPLCRASHSWL